MKLIWIATFTMLFTFSTNSFAQENVEQTDVEKEEMNIEMETDSLTLDGSDLEMTSLEQSSTDANKEEAASNTSSDIGELTLTEEDEEMANISTPKVDSLPVKNSEENPVNQMVQAEDIKAKETKTENIEIEKAQTEELSADTNKPAPSAVVDLGPVVGDQKYKITCQLNDDIRVITAIEQVDGSVGVVYKRFDTVKTIAIARRDPAYADQVVEKIYNNLANGKYPYACTKE